MAWTELTAARSKTGKVYQDSLDPSKRALDVTAGAAASVWVKLAENQWVALTHASVVYLTHL